MICTNCRADNPAGARFCNRCGSSALVSPPPAKRSKVGTFLWAVALVLLGGGGVAAYVYFGGRFPWQAASPNETPNAERRVSFTGTGTDLDKVTIDIPQGATNAANASRVSAALAPRPADIPTVVAPSGSAIAVAGKLVASGAGLDLAPDGLVFDKPVTIRLPLGKPVRGAIGYWVLHSAANGGWKALDEKDVTIDRANGALVVTVSHFSKLQPVAETSPAPPRVAPDGTPAPRTATPAEVERLKTMVLAFLKTFDRTCFGIVVSLGEPAYFTKALKEVEVIVDPAQGQTKQGEMSADGQTLTIVQAPGSPHLSADFPTTLWHELVHHIEVFHYDRWSPYLFYPSADAWKARLERNAEYMEHAVSVLAQLKLIEDQARAGTLSPAELRKRIEAREHSLHTGSPNAWTKEPDLKALREQTGFHVDFEAIKLLYRSGQCGERLKQAFDEVDAGPPAHDAHDAGHAHPDAAPPAIVDAGPVAIVDAGNPQPEPPVGFNHDNCHGGTYTSGCGPSPNGCATGFCCDLCSQCSLSCKQKVCPPGSWRDEWYACRCSAPKVATYDKRGLMTSCK